MYTHTCMHICMCIYFHVMAKICVYIYVCTYFSHHSAPFLMFMSNLII